MNSSLTLRWAISLLIFTGACWFSLTSFAAVPINSGAAIDALLPGKIHSIAEALVFNLRLPRMLVAILLGSSLALAGALLQVLTHNPLASPAVLGINSGAALAMALTSAFSPLALHGYPLSVVAAVGGGLSWLCVSAAGRSVSHNGDRQRLILAGIALSAFCMAMTRIILLLSEDHAFGILYWLAGGISQVRWPQVWLLLPNFLILAPLILLQARSLNLLNIGDDAAYGLGVNLRRLRLLMSAALLLLVGACVSVAGPLGFIGLLIPHLARACFGNDLRVMLPSSMLLGATLMLVADITSRWLAWPGELPAGVVLGLVGAPCFVWLARRRGQ